MQFSNLGKRSLELAFGASIQKINLQIEGTRGRLQVLCLGLGKKGLVGLIRQAGARPMLRCLKMPSG
jgi:hypothetical protein